MTRFVPQGAELAVIGAAFVQPETVDTLRLPPDAFDNAQAREVWRAILELRERQAPVTEVTLVEEVRGEGAWVPGFVRKCAELETAIPSAIAEHARIVGDYATVRRIMAASAEVKAKAEEGIVGDELHAFAMERMSSVVATSKERGRFIGEAAKSLFTQISSMLDRRNRGEIALSGVPTGITALDDLLSGWQYGIVSIVCARTSVGKSSMALTTAEAASAAGYAVHDFTLEDVSEVRALRSLSRSTGISAENIRAGGFREGEWSVFKESASAMAKNRHWYVDDSGGFDARELVRRVRVKRRDLDTKLVIVDYLTHLGDPEGSRSALESATRNIKVLADSARMDGLAYLVVAQLNRKSEDREDRRPRLSDLREAGEEQCKCAVGIFRPAMHGPPPGAKEPDDHSPQHEWDEWNRAWAEWNQKCELLVFKNSNGQANVTLPARWDGRTARIGDA